MNQFDFYLTKYREVVSQDSQRARFYIKKLDYKDNFYLLKCLAQTYLDESRFVEYSNQMRPRIHFKKWRLAEKYIIDSYNLDPDNAEVLYTMGEIRKLNSQDDIAIYCFEKIVKTGVKKVSIQAYSRGLDFAKELVNDARFELYRLYYNTDQLASRRYLKKYKENVASGTSTIFNPLELFLL